MHRRFFHGTERFFTYTRELLLTDVDTKVSCRMSSIQLGFIKVYILKIGRYWNWELDWQSLERSSTWNDSQGFGGDGDKKGAWTPGMGRCVVDGPFKNAQRLYFNGDVQPHCLGRGFVHFMTGKQGVLFGEWFSPEQIGELKRSKDYDSMRHTLENSLHNVLHWGIKGDFASITAANGTFYGSIPCSAKFELPKTEPEHFPDPVFWLHHAQLDRLWWQWQQAEPRRFSEYHGKAFSESLPGLERGATLDDRLTFSGMWEDIRVSDVMSPDNGLLCYKY